MCIIKKLLLFFSMVSFDLAFADAAALADQAEAQRALVENLCLFKEASKRRVCAYQYKLCEDLYDQAVQRETEVIEIEDSVIVSREGGLFCSNCDVLRSYALVIGATRQRLNEKLNDYHKDFIYVQSMQDFKNQIDHWRFKKDINGPKKCVFFDGRVLMMVELKMVVEQELGKAKVLFDSAKPSVKS